MNANRSCIDCGLVELPDRYPFTVCDECWDKNYPPKPKKAPPDTSLSAYKPNPDSVCIQPEGEVRLCLDPELLTAFIAWEHGLPRDEEPYTLTELVNSAVSDWLLTVDAHPRFDREGKGRTTG